MAPETGDLTVRRVGDGDLDEAIDLAAMSLGWEPGRPNDELFRWKHLENPFGKSPMWTAESNGRLVGLRTFLRWRFVAPGGELVTAVRAVDTATHPEFQGRGVFRTLTLHAVDELHSEGVGFVFNTPNEKSRPGYLKMGWTLAGRVSVQVKIHSLRSTLRVVRARAPAQKWSRSLTVGDEPTKVFGDDSEIEDLLSNIPPGASYRTERSPEYLRWRYSFAPLSYRAVVLDGSVKRGVAVFRVRRRGAATEATICELLVPGNDRSLARRLLDEVKHMTTADYLISAGSHLPLRTGFMTLPRQGPIMAWRALNVDRPAFDTSALTLGDIELF